MHIASLILLWTHLRSASRNSNCSSSEVCLASSPYEHHWESKIHVLVYKALHGQAPSDVTDMLQITTRRQFRLSCLDCTTLAEPRTRCVTFGDRAFVAYAPRLWNRLPGHIKDCTFEQFKNPSFQRCLPAEILNLSTVEHFPLISALGPPFYVCLFVYLFFLFFEWLIV